MSTVLLVMTDGRRDCISQAVPAALDNLHGPITHRIIYNDSEDPDYHEWLVETFAPRFTIIGDLRRRGFGGAIQRAWQHLRLIDTPWVFAIEDDMVITRPVDLNAMQSVLSAHPYLVQLALRRQPWNSDERAAGGVVEQWPDAYTECNLNGFSWLEHRLFWTTNASLFRRELCWQQWPTEARSEVSFTHRLLTQGLPNVDAADIRFGYSGSRDSGEWVCHIGAQRVGRGY